MLHNSSTFAKHELFDENYIQMHDIPIMYIKSFAARKLLCEIV